MIEMLLLSTKKLESVNPLLDGPFAPPLSPATLGLIGPGRKDNIRRTKTILMTSARSDQT
jgi:hypothetical protein